MRGPVTWLPEPPPGTAICLSFDGSDFNDWTVIRAETRAGHLFTPRYGPNRLGTSWNPAEWDGLVPRGEVTAAVDELMSRFKVARMYCDPPRWETDIENWALEHGEEIVQQWPTYRPTPMHSALERFRADLAERRITHDGCPVTALHIGNARMLAKPRDQYGLGKPSDAQKIDAAVGVVLAHEAACDVRAAGWPDPVDTRILCFR